MNVRAILSVFLILLAVTGRGETVVVDGVSYDFTSSTTASVVLGDQFYTGALTIPEQVNGHMVTALAAGAFNGCHGLKTVSLPSSLTSIGDYAFNGCDSLTSITIPEKVTTIGNHAFALCKKLTTLSVPDAVTCIGDYTFFGCSSLTQIDLGKGVASVGYRAFHGCQMLQTIVVAEDNAHLKSAGGVLYTAGGATLIAGPRRQSSRRDVVVPATVHHISPYACHTLSLTRTLTLSDSLLTIGERAFAGSTLIKEVTLPASLTAMGVDAFDGCSALTQVTCLASKPLPLNEFFSPFGFFTDLQRFTLRVPRGASAAYRAASVWRDFGAIIELGTAGVGDVNGDGEVSLADVTALVALVLGEQMPPDYIGRADVNGDGEASVADVTNLTTLVMQQ
ncbi:MAG: leucine-rich repeat protein [Muribaculaceae bacterium]|nr:leucine-rich repeat protein [Muribaculaceae bacterium]